MSKKNKKTWQKYFKQEPGMSHVEPNVRDDHKMVTRRDFVAAGLKSGLGVAYASSAVTFLANNPAFAAECSSSQLGSNWMPFIELYLSGGNKLGMKQFAVGRGNNPLDHSNFSSADYNRWGLNVSQAGLFSPIGGTQGMLMQNNSPFRQGMAAFLSQAEMARINGYVIARSNNDDTSANEMCALHLAVKAMNSATKIALMGSNDNGTSPVGTNLSLNSYNPLVTPDIVNNLNTIANKYNLNPMGLNGDGSNLVNKSSKIQKLLELVQARSIASIKKLEATSNSPAALTQKITCDFQNNIANSNGPGFDPNPATYAPVNSVMGTANGITINGAAFNFNNNELARVAAMTTAVCQGASNAFGMTKGGYDYHQQGIATQNNKDREAGATVGAMIKALFNADKGGQITIYTDGHTGGGTNTDGTHTEEVSDAGQFGCAVVLAWLPPSMNTIIPTIRNNGGSSTTSAQLGSITGTGVQNNSWYFSNNNTGAAETIIYNYMALHGKLGEYATLFPNSLVNGVADKNLIQIFPAMIAA